VSAVGVIGAMYNSYVYAVHFVHLLYFVKSDEDDDQEDLNFEDPFHLDEEADGPNDTKKDFGINIKDFEGGDTDKEESE